MKKKIWLFTLLVVFVLIGLVLVFSKNKSEEKGTNITYKEEKVSVMTIENTITSSGEVISDTINISLSTSKYFSKIYYSTGTYIKKGTKILKYTNGTYYKAPYNLVLVGYNLPDSSERIRDNHYLQVKKVDSLKMNLSINEEDISKVKVGQSSEITINAIDGKTYTGKISYINQIGSYSSSGSKFSSYVTFKNDGKIKIGMSGSVSIVVEKAENVLAVPIEAVQTKGKSKYVVVVLDDGSTVNKEVETGISSSAYVEIKSGLTGEETIRMIEISNSNNNMMMGQFGDRINFGSSGFPQGERPSKDNRPSF